VRDEAFLCHQGLLAEGQARGFDPWGEGRDTVLALKWQGQVRVWLNRCPHVPVSMQYRKDRFMSGDGRHIVCFAHGALFDPGSGACLAGPCVGQSLCGLVVRVDEDQGLWLCGGQRLTLP
jgi:nitrite reductase/ring-hydroxylating ferredoxin subunit